MKALGNTHEFSNALVGSASLYLRQHAHNPVMWYPWGQEAIELARRLNRPILLSIGYSSCYWCHVMEREVFENPSIAAYMNEHFINIKLDREEHPAIDETYMVARQLMTREGGWPNNLFLTPELKPFYAGGTYGAQDIGDRPAFPRLLEWLNYQWIEQNAETLKTAEEVYALTQRFLKPTTQSIGSISGQGQVLAEKLVEDLIAKHDDIAGGFYTQPKFPHETYLDFLITAGQLLDHKGAIDAAVHSLLHMSAGGIYDQVSCGFHRYAVDKHWYVPHFEKMLYNQALLATVYTDLFVLTNNPNLASVAQGTLDFVSGPLNSNEGGFYTAIDAETDGVEGAYYAWEAEEIQKILNEEELAFFTHYFALADIPHFSGHKKVQGQVIVGRKSLWEAAKDDNLPYLQISALAGQVMNKLLSVRNQRQAPLLDDKIITSWNGLMIHAYARASRVFGHQKFLQIAENAADFIVTKMLEVDGSLSRIHANGKSIHAGLLEDYSYFAQGLLSLHIAKNNESPYLDIAKNIMNKADAIFFDAATQTYRLNVLESGMIEIAHISDSAIPSPVSVMLENWTALYELNPNDALKKRLSAMFDAGLALIKPAALPEFSSFLKALLKFQNLTGDLNTERFDNPALAVVKLQATLSHNETPANQSKIHVKLDILEGWYIYPNYSPNNIATNLTIAGADVGSILSIEYPKAQKIDLGGHVVSAYAGSVEIIADIELKQHAVRQEITVTLEYQACKQGICSPKASSVYRL